MVTATAVEVFRCRGCERPICDWDGAHITIQHSGNGGVPIYIQIPVNAAVVKCHHVLFDHGRRVPCGTINRVAFPAA